MVLLGVIFGVTALMIPEIILTLYSRAPLVLEQAQDYLRILGVSFFINAISTVLITGLRSMCGGFGTAAAVMIGMRLGKSEYEETKLCCEAEVIRHSAL